VAPDCSWLSTKDWASCWNLLKAVCAAERSPDCRAAPIVSKSDSKGLSLVLLELLMELLLELLVPNNFCSAA
jgi:hypothetical protein